MIRLNPWGHYRGPGGADPEKSREQRERELFGMMESPDGPEIILFLWQEVEGIPAGECTPAGTTMRAEMIPGILKHEYPNSY